MNHDQPSSREAHALDQLRFEDRRKALRALPRKPLLLADEAGDATDFARVRRNADELREWFSRHAGWSLDITAECARLRKIPADLTDGTRPAHDDRSGEPFTRRRYVLLSLALAALSRSDRQTTLGRIAEQILCFWNEEQAFSEVGLTFRLETSDERRDLVHVIRLLLSWRVLRRVDGSEEKFICDRSADVLYSIRHVVLSKLLVARRAPSLVAVQDFEARLAAMIEEPSADTDEQRNRRIRVALVRRLLDDPVIYYQELDPEEKTYVQRQRWHLLTQLAQATGFEAEERAEGFALVDSLGDCSDIGMPEEGTDGHATILVAEFLAARRAESKESTVSFNAISDFLAAKAKEHSRHWRRDVLVHGSEHSFARQIVTRLAGLGLIRIKDSSVMPMPAIHRFRMRETTSEVPK